MEQQTAVEWLENQINNMIKNGGDLGDNYPALLKHIEQAKQMEKEYIINSNRDGVDMCVKQKPFITGEEYYNKTFKTK